ncbi:cupin domain-containing protein [Labrys wisconsinensis]|uniref:Mannose-6-phosphate isomerase-like protein (Cupin superfamily) n=1 Tax=Labrys wisconsinensis TaxID=425677 RepID=A0ABU0J5G0_9HYPH|nr:cupin domain-containing protein [Labrys wisconsinensis]MDQ0469506.1 mannose-6-phosphate isomerase-like protein (cupin superfamily) [Labrys wisconsinensis]
MKPIAAQDRVVRNILTTPYEPLTYDGIAHDRMTHITLDPRRPAGTGLYALRMAPGSVSTAHEHPTDEIFYVLEGELIDHDGTVYRTGDMVLLRPGTQHASHTPAGCTLLVYQDQVETPV